MSSVMEKDEIVLALDCEFSGTHIVDNFIPEFAWIAMTFDEKVISEGHGIMARQKHEKWDPETVKWMSGEPEMTNMLLRRGANIKEIADFFLCDGSTPLVERGLLHPIHALTEFKKAIDDLREKYIVYMVSDFPERDMGCVNYALCRYTASTPLFMHGNDYYHPSKCSGSFMEGATGSVSRWTSNKAVAEKLGFTCPPAGNHHPLEDARNIALCYIRTFNAIKAQS